MRKLATIREVSEITPIEGRDRIVLATVDGWHVIVTKEDFHVGTKCVYCEIDSVMPEKPEFEFLRPKKFRIRTMKMAGVISQGICFPLSILPPKPDGSEYEIGEDVTDIIGVKQYEETMDTGTRELSSQPKKKYPRWLMRFKWFRNLVTPKKTNGSFPSFIPKTDETRCLDGNTKILTDKGVLRIADIVNKHIGANVLSWNEETDEFEWSRITDYQKYPADNKMYRIRYAFRPNSQRQNTLICTPDHKLLTQQGYKCASELTINDSVAYPVYAYHEEVIPFVYGMLLGDAHLANDRRTTKNGLHSKGLRIIVSHGEKQICYLTWKEMAFALEDVKRHKSKSGYSNNNVYVSTIRQDCTITNTLYADGCVCDGKLKINSAFCDRITPLSLAIWYMDDGVCRHLNNDVYHNETYGSPAIELSTNSFDDEEVSLLSDMLTFKFGIENTIRNNKRNGKTYPLIYITTKATPIFLKLIAPYVPECMRYKLFGDALKIEPVQRFTYSKSIQVFYDRIESIDCFELSKFSNHKYVYDIEVENNHNFVANGIISHNCQNMPWILKDKQEWIATEKIDGQSGTFALVKHKKLFFTQYEYIVCSRNLRLGTKDNSSYWQVSDKYNIENALRNMIGDREWIAIQGECIGPRIQKNKYGVKDCDLFVFNLIYPDGRVGSVKAKSIIENKGMNFVPIIDEHVVLPDTVDEVLAYAHGTSRLANTLREGIVFRTKDGKQSFKAVDPEFLLKWSE